MLSPYMQKKETACSIANQEIIYKLIMGLYTSQLFLNQGNYNT